MSPEEEHDKAVAGYDIHLIKRALKDLNRRRHPDYWTILRKSALGRRLKTFTTNKRKP
jgi:hypothetical protein